MIPETAAPVEALIVGGGPAGLFAALRLAAGLQAAGRPVGAGGILILEKRERPARKLLLSGSGQCNLTHAGDVEDFLPRYGSAAAGRFLKPALYAFTNEELLDWFQARGLEFETEEGGKVFPRSRRATDVLAILLRECEALGIRLEGGWRVESVARQTAGGPGFRVSASRGELRREIEARLLLLATGGASYPVTGSSGDGYALAASLGHRILPPRPALAPVSCRNFPLGGLAGLSFRGAGLSLRRGGRKLAEFQGDLLITHEGLSGPLILDASRHFAPGDVLELRLASEGAEEFRARLEAELARSPRALIRRVLAQAGLPKSLAERLAELAGAGPDDRAAELRRERRAELVRLATAFPVEVAALGGFDLAMATAGGVELSEVEPKSLESRVTPGLFFAGELLDLDGDSGGFNLHAAFSTGALAAEGMRRALTRA